MLKRLNQIMTAGFIAGLLGGVPAANAMLPAAVDGQALPTLAPMLEQVTPAVVHIATQGKAAARSPMQTDPFFERFFGAPQRREKRSQGLGSGVIIDAEKGHILTNSHVIQDAGNITVTLKDGRKLEASVIGADPDADIAIIKIEAKKLTAIPLADSSKLRVGDFVVAIGNPYGLEQTATSGIVSALGRRSLGIESYEDFIQTDASINPGNSGGALVNLRGELVGINTAIFAPNGSNIGIGFAIPVNMAKSVTSQLIEFGEVRRGQLGVGIQDLTPELAAAFDIETRGGAIVSQVQPDSPADKAGVQAGDVVTAVNGNKMSDASQLRNAVGMLRIGSEITLDLLRDGKPVQLTARVEEPEQHEFKNAKGSEITNRLNGAYFKSIVADGETAVQITDIEPGSNAAKAGLTEGDIILSVNRQRVASMKEMTEAIALNEKALLLNILRDGRGLFLLIQ
jgi:serine protease Do/serine protease DegQ